jgi:hypothetical protein
MAVAKRKADAKQNKKIPLSKATASEIRASYKITPAEHKIATAALEAAVKMPPAERSFAARGLKPRRVGKRRTAAAPRGTK